jgi:tyrosyl-tRNA synthetase
MENYKFKSAFLNILQERTLLNQVSNPLSLDEALISGKITGYIGFDCTASSLHIGNYIQILLLKYLQQSGHNIIALMGEGTTLIGDPSGKDTTRKMLSSDDIKSNMLKIKNDLSKFITFDAQNILLSNASWLLEFKYLEFLRDFGTHFTINRMLGFDSVKLRLERDQPLTFLEFNYMLLQAVDFLHLNKNYGVSLQMGGSDQWGNIINGVELIRKTQSKEAFALTTPLLLKKDGSKMGKTASGALWLNKELCSVWDFYQYFRNVEDEVVIDYLKKLTMIPIAEINKLDQLKGQELNEAKKILAYEMCKIVHGVEEANKVLELAVNTFEKKILDDNLPTINLTSDQLKQDLSVIFLLTTYANVNSNSEARKLITNLGIKINDITLKDVNKKINTSDFLNNTLKLSLGKKKHILFKI